MGASWGAELFSASELGRKGRAETCAEVVEAIAASGGKSFSSACGGRLRQSGGDLLGRADQNPARLLTGPQAAVGERCRGRDLVLVPSDTTSLNLSGRKSLSELGGIGDQLGAQGLLCHGALAVGEDGEPLGIVDVQPWSRAEPLEEGEERPYEEKESFKWERALRVIERVLGDRGATVVVLTDAESDGFEYLSAARRKGVELLARASQNRAVRSGELRGLLWAVTGGWELRGQMEVDVPRRAGKRPATAVLEVRYGEVEVQPPSRLSGWPAVRIGVVRATETAASREARGVRAALRAGEVSEDETREVKERGIDWVLYTTLAVGSVGEARRRVRWYAQRWRIEELHRTLKTGLKLEALQVRSVAALMNHVALYYVSAWRVLALAYIGRTDPERPATTVLSADELRVMALVTERRVETVREATRALAVLGGREMYPSSPDPGAPSMWQGLQALGIAMQVDAAYRRGGADDGK